MKTIKFRGRLTETGEFVYGDYLHKSPIKGKPAILEDNGHVSIIEPDSVAQLVGHDKGGREVYEGDLLTDEKGFEYVASIQSMVYIPTEARTIPLDFVKRFTPLKLKEANHEGD